MIVKREVAAPLPNSKFLVFGAPMTDGFMTGARIYVQGGYIATAVNSPVPSYPGFNFTAASTMYLDIGAGPASVKTVALWVKPNSVAGTDYPIDLNGTDFLTIVTGTLTKNGFAGGTTVLYTDGVAAATTVTAAWHHIAITDTSAKNANDFDIARETANYFDGLISEVYLYSAVLADYEIASLYYSQREKYQI